MVTAVQRDQLTPLDRALAKLSDGELLTVEEAVLVKASLNPAVVASTEASSASPTRIWLVAADVDPDAEAAFVRGEGPDPWRG